MRFPNWAVYLGILGLGFLTSPAAAQPAKPGRLPNFVIVFADDMGYGDLGCFGAKGHETPNLDRMAKEGTRFTSFYVAQPVCSASRAALMTGCYPNRVSILGALPSNSKTGISDREMTLAQVLKPRGYATALYGKWHLGHLPKFLPTRHGFDDYFGIPYSNDMKPTLLVEGDQPSATKLDQNQLTTWYTERAVQFIEKNKDRPFFLYVAHSMPHVPIHVSGKFRGKSKDGLYGDVIAEIDWSVGQILEALKKNGLDEQTFVVFTSDNGPWLVYGKHGGSAGPLREGKGTTWEGGVREPCIMRWPGKIPAGAVCSEPLMTIDLLPTFARLAGAELPKNQIDGLNVWPVLAGESGAKNPHEAYYFYWGRELQAVRSGKWKLHFPHNYSRLAEKEGKGLVYVQAKTGLALYDLESDAGEKNDVADKHPDTVTRLRKLADAMREDLGDTATRQKGTGVRESGRE